jgi:hypothetical protein
MVSVTKKHTISFVTIVWEAQILVQVEFLIKYYLQLTSEQNIDLEWLEQALSSALLFHGYSMVWYALAWPCLTLTLGWLKTFVDAQVATSANRGHLVSLSRVHCLSHSSSPGSLLRLLSECDNLELLISTCASPGQLTHEAWKKRGADLT